jgi:hypothetical protein
VRREVGRQVPLPPNDEVRILVQPVAGSAAEVYVPRSTWNAWEYAVERGVENDASVEMRDFFAKFGPLREVRHMNDGRRPQTVRKVA